MSDSLDDILKKRRERSRQALRRGGLAIPEDVPEKPAAAMGAEESPQSPAASPGDVTAKEPVKPPQGEDERTDFSTFAAPGAGPRTALTSPLPVIDHEAQELKRLYLLDDVHKALRDEVRAAKLEAGDGEYNLFKCDIDRSKSSLPIVVQFSKHVQAGDKIESVPMKPVTLTSHSEMFKENGIPLTLTDAVNFTWGVESNIANSGFEWATKLRRSGSAVVTDDLELPPAAYDIKQYRSSGVKERSGWCSYDIVIDNPLSKKKAGQRPPLTISFPLGLVKRPNITADAIVAIDDEAIERAAYIQDKLESIRRGREKERGNSDKLLHVITKGSVEDLLKDWVKGHPGKEWAEPSRTRPLKGFEKPYPLWTSPDADGQKITLSPITVTREDGGENPSHIMNIAFHIGDKHKKIMGERVRTRKVRLHTLDEPLAERRAIESLVGAPDHSGGVFVKPFLQGLQTYMDEHPQDQWHVVNRDQPNEEVMIGNKPLSHFLDNMMRYEHDMGIEHKAVTQGNGDVIVNFIAFRGFSGDYKGELDAVHERLYDKTEDQKGRKPVGVALTIPKAWVEGHDIEKFASMVQDEMRWDIARLYSPVIPADGRKYRDDQQYYIQQAPEEDKYRSPQEYRTITISNSLATSVKSSFKKEFGVEVPKGSLKELDQLGAEGKAINGHSGGNPEEAHFRRLPPSGLEGDSPHTRRAAKRARTTDGSRLL